MFFLTFHFEFFRVFLSDVRSWRDLLVILMNNLLFDHKSAHKWRLSKPELALKLPPG